MNHQAVFFFRRTVALMSSVALLVMLVDLAFVTTHQSLLAELHTINVCTLGPDMAFNATLLLSATILQPIQVRIFLNIVNHVNS